MAVLSESMAFGGMVGAGTGPLPGSTPSVLHLLEAVTEQRLFKALAALPFKASWVAAMG